VIMAALGDNLQPTQPEKTDPEQEQVVVSIEHDASADPPIKDGNDAPVS
jgi:hypothetical protein